MSAMIHLRIGKGRYACGVEHNQRRLPSSQTISSVTERRQVTCTNCRRISVSSQPSTNNSRRLKAVGRPEQWREGLVAFRDRHALSFRGMESICQGAISNRTLRRLESGVDVPRCDVRCRRRLIDSIRSYLEGRQLSEVQIYNELRSIFCEEEVGPLITQRMVLTKPAQSFFGLRFDPFTGDPRNRSEIFSTPKLDRIAAQVEDAIRYQGFLAVIGDVGSGKSLLKERVVQTALDSKGKLEILWPQFFNMELVHSASICSFVLHKFGQKVPQDRSSRAEKLRQLLASLSEDGVRVALGFDECHRLHPNLLTALKNFWELGSGGFDRYLGLVLFGQPRFEMTLRNVDFREISERLDIVRMPDLSKRDDAYNYLGLRLKSAGGSIDKLFDRAAIQKLQSIAATPLALGNLANAGLMTAFRYTQPKVTVNLISEMSSEPRVRAVGRGSVT